MTLTRSPKLAVFALLSALLLGCGGDSAGSKSAGSPDEASAAAEDSVETASNDGEAAEEAEAEPARGPNCDDGTCSMCAGSLCPNGWYCDESAKACSWLRECPEKPSCACVTKVLGSSCKCSEEGGIPHVECG